MSQKLAAYLRSERQKVHKGVKVSILNCQSAVWVTSPDDRWIIILKKMLTPIVNYIKNEYSLNTCLQHEKNLAIWM